LFFSVFASSFVSNILTQSRVRPGLDNNQQQPNPKLIRRGGFFKRDSQKWFPNSLKSYSTWATPCSKSHPD